jgi:hypothetical protein
MMGLLVRKVVNPGVGLYAAKTGLAELLFPRNK